MKHQRIPRIARRQQHGDQVLGAWHTIGGHPIEQGALVILSQWVVHRDPRWWDEPDTFKPERWLSPSESAAARPKYAYFPFGGGSRVCIGESFAWTEAILLLATIAPRW